MLSSFGHSNNVFQTNITVPQKLFCYTPQCPLNLGINFSSATVYRSPFSFSHLMCLGQIG